MLSLESRSAFVVISLTGISFLKQHLNVSGPEAADVESLKLEVTELRQKCEQLQEENVELKAKVCTFLS